MSSSLKESVPYATRLVDPRFNSSGLRSEFRLDRDTAYYSDLRLINIGFSSASGATVYNGLLGAEVPIRSISLLDGGTVIEAINEFQEWRPIQKVNSTNNPNISMGRYLSHNNLGYISQGQVSIDSTDFMTQQTVVVAQPPAASVGVTEAASKKTWISLKDIFASLRSMSVIPTNVFRQMRVVVEYSTSTKLVADNTKTDLATALPLLVADELMASPVKMQAMKSFQGISYLAVEQDSFALEAIANPADAATRPEQQVTSKLKGFNGKYIKDLILKFTPTNAQVTGGGANKLFGQLGSQALWSKGSGAAGGSTAPVQVTVNGVDILPRAGAVGSMRRLAMTTDTMGPLNVLWAQSTCGPRFTAGLSDSVSETVGEMALLACDVESGIEDLQVAVTRYGVIGNDDQNQRIVVNAFARVPKSILVGPDGKYTVMYSQSG